MVKKSKVKPNKGKFVTDANANREYVKIAIEVGWTQIPVPHTKSHEKIPDEQIVSKYTQGIHPIFTADKTAYKITGKDLKKSGYIIHKVVSKKEDKKYRENIKEFFTKYSEKHTHGTKWTIEQDGNYTSEKIETE